MPVVKTMEVGTAARNGYLWIRPTGQAARERGLSDGELPGMWSNTDLSGGWADR